MFYAWFRCRFNSSCMIKVKVQLISHLWGERASWPATINRNKATRRPPNHFLTSHSKWYEKVISDTSCKGSLDQSQTPMQKRNVAQSFIHFDESYWSSQAFCLSRWSLIALLKFTFDFYLSFKKNAIALTLQNYALNP